MKIIIPALLLLISFQFSAFAETAAADSTGLEEVDGKVYILHKVEEKETLYSLSRRYNVPIYQIIENNPPTEFGLEVGQIIRVPLGVGAPKKIDGTVHVVKPGETVFSISRLYNVSIDEIRRWNNMEDNLLKIGQRLAINAAPEKEEPAKVAAGPESARHRVIAGETLYSISRKYDMSIDELKEKNGLSGNEISIGQILIVGDEKKDGDSTGVESADRVASKAGKALNFLKDSVGVKMDSAVAHDNVITKEQALDKDKASTTAFGGISESGLAELIEGTSTTRKYLALHRTAKIGTILRVRNEMNGQEVFVRILGRLPESGVNENVVIRISRSAYDQLGAIDPRFLVTVFYIP